MTDKEFWDNLRIGVMDKNSIGSETYAAILAISQEYILTLIHDGFTVQQVTDKF